jgi:hypothetical protein
MIKHFNVSCQLYNSHWGVKADRTAVGQLRTFRPSAQFRLQCNHKHKIMNMFKQKDEMSKCAWRCKISLQLIQIFTLFPALLLIPLQANAADLSWQGVWNGTVGKSKVIVCLTTNGSSSYRYQRYQTEIPLSQQGEE